MRKNTLTKVAHSCAPIDDNYPPPPPSSVVTIQLNLERVSVKRTPPTHAEQTINWFCNRHFALPQRETCPQQVFPAVTSQNVGCAVSPVIALL